MLSINNIDVYYGKVRALSNISIEIVAEEIVSVIGANGAGKTTLMKAIMGITPPSKGSIMFNGEDLTGLESHEIVKKGIIYVPEGRRIFPDLSVYDNLEMGAYSKKYSKKEFNSRLEEQYEIFPRLKERATQLGGSLSGGEQQMLAIARGLMADPKLLMLDEPSLGLAPIIVEDIFDIITMVNKKKKLPILLVEQNAYMALETSNTGYVIELGDMKPQGPAAELLESDEIKKAYLGG